MRHLFLSAAILLATVAATQNPGPPPLGHAHAHNDYTHDRPLLDALDRGFQSVEADVHLVDGELLVAHDREDCDASRTLRALYLQPLAERVRRHGGRVHPGGPLEFQLLIDLKSDGEPTYRVLREQLAEFARMLTRFDRSPRRRGAVLVVLSGNAPDRTVVADPERLCALDLWVDEPDLGADVHPLFSTSWRKHFAWDPAAPGLSAEQLSLLRRFVATAHAAGRRVRLWATPDDPALWSLLLREGVDWLNVDDLDAGAAFLRGPGARLHERASIDRLLDDRFGDPAATDRLAQRLVDDGLACAEIERLLAGPRVTVSRPANLPRGKLIGDIPLVCEHVDYETVFLLYVPTTLAEDRPAPLVVVGHGGNSAMDRDYARRAAAGGTVPWIAEAERHGFVLAAPLTGRGWLTIGNSVVLSLVSELKRWFHIDPDRVHVTGHSMGGHLSWRTALSMSDRFGAIAPMSGGYDYVERNQIRRLWNTSGYATFGRREPYGIADHNRRIRDWLVEHAYPWTVVEKPGGHEIFADEMPKVAAFLMEHPRVPWPEVVYFQLGADPHWQKAANLDTWDRQHTWNPERPIRQSMSHWLQPLPRPDLPEGTTQEAVARVDRSTNTIEVVSQGVRGFTVDAHPQLLDLERPIRIVANGVTCFAGRITPDPRCMLETARAYDDRGRRPWARIECAVATDLPVPEPSAFRADR